LHVAGKLRVRRSEVIAAVLSETGVDLKQPSSGDAIVTAINYLESLRLGGAALPSRGPKMIESPSCIGISVTSRQFLAAAVFYEFVAYWGRNREDDAWLIVVRITDGKI
jgi:hypothetical protein